MALPGRTTATAVKGIITTVVSANLDPYIDSANELVTEVCASQLAADGVTAFYSTARLELIERWLAAHFYTIFDPRSASEKVSVITQRLQGKIDLGLDSSLYGQNAMRLDTKGGLAAMNNAMKKQEGTLAGRGTIVGGAYWMGTGSYEESQTAEGENSL